MEKYIEASAVINELQDIRAELNKLDLCNLTVDTQAINAQWYAYKKAQTMLEQAPAVEVEPVIHAHWRNYKADPSLWVCTHCKFTSEAFAAPTLYKRCPNCGAHMDEEKVVE